MGSYAEELRTERWEATRPMWNFMPPGDGPRICPVVLYPISRFYRVFATPFIQHTATGPVAITHLFSLEA
ncbi:hypothetical protein F4775DRAFT_378608 [Biscogniauxia sp. FL1348]|nr:hypothetical protein F4775DRAFT_378608 [Biscogniauxia sp. FL1348]